MAIVVKMAFAGTSLDQYDAVMREAGLSGPGPHTLPGLRAHYAWEEEGDLQVLDVWETTAGFEESFSGRIQPAAQRAGIALHPVVKISPLHNSIP